LYINVFVIVEVSNFGIGVVPLSVPRY